MKTLKEFEVAFNVDGFLYFRIEADNEEQALELAEEKLETVSLNEMIETDFELSNIEEVRR